MDDSTEQQYQTIGMCEIELLQPFCLVIFGAAGDLSKKKLLPAIYHLFIDHLLPDDFFVFCVDRVPLNTDEYRETIMQSLKSALPKGFDGTSWDVFARRVYYASFDFTVPELYMQSLQDKLPPLEIMHQTGGNRIFYLAIPPTVFERVIENLGTTGLSGSGKGYAHIVVEKPFGRDMESAIRLNRLLSNYFTEDQIFRIDHYVAKETVQNILMFRFANSIFEPLWNRGYIDHVQITVAETIGIENRAGYYEQSGVIRDMFQSHILHLLAVTAMEPPVAFKATHVREEKTKVFRSVRPFPLDTISQCIIVGQYGEGVINGKPVVAYRKEPGVTQDSKTPTYAAMKISIDNWRWNGVPFYLRSGKRMSVRKTEISIYFKSVPHMMFSKVMDEYIEPNVLVFRLQPDEGINLTFQTKKPGTKVCLNPVVMDFSYQKDVLLEAYEWVLLDCILGDQMLFLHQEGVEQTWSLLTSAIDALESDAQVKNIPVYPAGSPGPDEANLFIERDGRSWRPLLAATSDESADISRLRGHQH